MQPERVTAWEEGVEEDHVEEGSVLETGGLGEINGSFTYQQTGPCSISLVVLPFSLFLYEPWKM